MKTCLTVSMPHLTFWVFEKLAYKRKQGLRCHPRAWVGQVGRWVGGGDMDSRMRGNDKRGKGGNDDKGQCEMTRGGVTAATGFPVFSLMLGSCKICMMT
jgi:hypothetical protein